MVKQSTVTNLSPGLVAAGKISYALRAEGETAYGAETTVGIMEVAGSVGEYLAAVAESFFYGTVRWTEWTEFGVTASRQAVDEFHNFGIDAIKARTELITSGKLNIVSPVSDNGSQITLVAGDDYFHVHGRSIDFISDDYPDLTGATCALRVVSRDTRALVFSVVGTIVDARTLRYELSHAETALLTPANLGTYVFSSRVIFADGQIATEKRGQVLVLDS